MCTDKNLLKWYMNGFNHRPTEPKLTTFDSILEKKAYELGICHYIVGDDCESVDYLTADEILDLIKKS